MADDGLNISQGMGEGAAQVLKPYHNHYLDQLIAQKQEKRKVGDKNQQDALNKLGSLNKLDIFFRDQPKFKELQGDLYNTVKKNIYKIREGDPDALAEFQGKIADIENQAALSKNTREQYESLAKDVLMKKGEYRPETHNYLEEFASDKNIGNYNFDFSKVKKNTDLYQDFRSNLLPTLIDAKTKGQIAIPQADGSVVTKKTEELKDTDATKLTNTYLSDPTRLEQATYDFDQLPAEKQDQYAGDVGMWYKDNFVKPYIKTETFKTQTEAPREKTKTIDVVPEVNTKVNVGIANAKNEKVGEGTATGTKWRFPKTIPVQANPSTMFDIETGVAEQTKGDYKMSVSEVVELPTITDKDGNQLVVPANKIEEFKKKSPEMKGIENKKYASVLVETKDDKGHIIRTPKYIPYETISPQIKEQGIHLKDSQPIKQEIPSKPKRGDTLQTKQGLAEFDGAKWVLKK